MATQYRYYWIQYYTIPPSKEFRGEHAAAFATSDDLDTRADVLALTGHAYPSLAEIVKEAALAAYDKPLNS